MSEIIQHEVNGLHFKPGDEDDLISKVIQITESDELAKRLSDHARMSYTRLYTPEQNYAQLVGVYEKVRQQQEYFKPVMQSHSLT